MAVDQIAPGEVSWKHLAATPELPALIRSYDQALAYNFDVYVPGNGETDSKEDIKNTTRICKRSEKFFSVRINQC